MVMDKQSQKELSPCCYAVLPKFQCKPLTPKPHAKQRNCMLKIFGILYMECTLADKPTIFAQLNSFATS